jgi:HPt (histidine-containing phosphotransfer) domain-containing protein
MAPASSGDRADESAQSPVADDTLDPAMIAQLRATLDGDMRAQLYRGFESVLPARVASIEGAIRDGDPVALRKAAHLLRGTSITLGAAGLSELCRRLETTAREDDPRSDDQLIAQLREVTARTEAALSRELA